MFVTVTELAELLRKDYYSDKTIDFTDDTEEEGNEPSGWYGVSVTHQFDCCNLVFGYYGGGIVYSESVGNNGADFEDVIIDFWSSEFDRKITRDTKIWIDRED